MEATKRPWKIDDNEELPLAIITDNDNGDGIAEIGNNSTPAYAENETNWANAELIVRAVNSHDALMAALERLVGTLEDDAANRAYKAEMGVSEWESFIPAFIYPAFKQARAALEAAKGE